MKYTKGEFTTTPSKTARRGLSPTLQTVYTWLCDYSGEDDTCYPSRTTLANDCGISVRTLDRALTDLEGLKLIKKSNRFNQSKQTSNIYTVLIIEDIVARGGDKSALGGDKNDTGGGDKSAHRTQPNKNSTHLTQSNAKALGKAEVYGKPEINELFIFWKEQIGYDIISNKQRNRNACNNLVKKHGKEGVMKLIRGVAQSQTDKFAPRIADFVSLQAKQNELMAWGKSKMVAIPKVAII